MLTPLKMVCTHFTVFVCQNISRICQSHADAQKTFPGYNLSLVSRVTTSAARGTLTICGDRTLESKAEPSNNILKLASLVVHLFMQCLSSLMNKNQEKLCFFQLKPENKSTVYTSNSNHFILAKNS